MSAGARDRHRGGLAGAISPVVQLPFTAVGGVRFLAVVGEGDRAGLHLGAQRLKDILKSYLEDPSPRITQEDMVLGDYAYMSNLPSYRDIHAGGAFAGENSVYMSPGFFYGLDCPNPE
ncbi:MAG: hypothetical protein JWM91_3422 [Rhodospirillales bacterium]|nr:hypothetical protein [Rhodospirillales bacterium]